MKLAKKVLSVVLALVLALGAFAVVGSANGPVDSDYQIKIWLTGSVGSATWTTNSKVTIDEGDESDAGATIEVQPGDTVFVRFYITNNYYVHTFQSNVFYSAELIDAAEVYAAQRGRAITAANLKKIHIWNEDHYWAGLQGTSYSAQNAWSLMVESFQQNAAQNWPADDEGNCTLDMSEWKFNIFNNIATEGVGETSIFDDDSTHLFMMPVTVPDDAQPGDTFYVTIPEGLEQRTAHKYGSLRLYEIGVADGEDEPCDVVDAQSLLYPNMQWSDDNQYFDLSEATLTLVVPGASQPTVDYTALNEKMAEAADLLAAGGLTASSVEALNNAITAGNAALTSDDQDVVDAVVEQLTKVIADAKALADFTDLNEQISRYDALDADAYEVNSFAAATAAYNEAKAIDQNEESDQDAVDAATAALKNAIDNLAAALDYSALNAYIAQVEDTDTSIYTDETAGAFNAALAEAKSLVATTQADIDNALADLEAAYTALDEKAADYTALDKAIADFEAIDANAWTPDSYAAAKTAYDAAKAVDRNLKISAQATVTAAADELNAKISALVPAGAADYEALDAAIAEAKALVADNYVSFADVAAALAAAEAVDRNLTANDQATINNAADALVAAMAALVEAEANYEAVIAAQAAAQAILDKKDGGVNSYSDATLEAINAALATVETGLKKKDQDKVDAMAKAIEDAVAGAEFRAWDYTAINDHIAAIEAKDAKYYDAAEYADYLAAKEALVWDYTYEFYAKAMLQQVNFLKINPKAAAAADYSAVNDAIDAFEEKIGAADYEQDGIDAVNAIIDAIDWDLSVNDQDIVDKYAEDIIAATAALVEVVVEYVDYTRLDNAIAAAKALDADLYTASSYHEITVNLYTAESISRNLTADQQDFVDDVAKTLEDAIAALEKKAYYTTLDAAILRAGTYDKNAWTDATWAVVEEKLAAAEAVARDLGVSAQGTIDEAAAALNAALDALVAKDVVSSISTITYTPSDDTHNTFDVVVNGRMAMVQFIEEDGGTRTYDRYNKNVTIKSYNAEGVEVNSLDRSVAYEVWTINTNLIGPNVEVRTKYLVKNQYIWETEKYSFTLQFVEPTFDAEIRSITPAATSGKKGAVTTVVVVGPDAEGVRFVMENGTTSTYFADKAVVLDNGDLEFTGKAWMNEDGLNSVYVKVKVNGVWETVDCIEYTVE